MRVLDLFSGIGGFSLGLERAGMKTVAFCEIEPYPRAILAKHWPGVPCYDDVRTLTAERLRADGVGPVDLICGGFPCQDLSVAGKQAGIDGARSGLWGEIARLAGELRPRYVVVENVAALLSGDDGRWFGRVLGDLAALGYDAEWHCVPASAVGGFQRRDRAWVIAYPASSCGPEILSPYAFHAFRRGAGLHVPRRDDADVDDENRGPGAMSVLGDAFWPAIPDRERSGSDGRLSDGLDRYRALGNAVVPQIPEIIGRAIMAVEAERAAA